MMQSNFLIKSLHQLIGVLRARQPVGQAPAGGSDTGFARGIFAGQGSPAELGVLPELIFRLIRRCIIRLCGCQRGEYE